MPQAEIAADNATVRVSQGAAKFIGVQIGADLKARLAAPDGHGITVLQRGAFGWALVKLALVGIQQRITAGRVAHAVKVAGIDIVRQKGGAAGIIADAKPAIAQRHNLGGDGVNGRHGINAERGFAFGPVGVENGGVDFGAFGKDGIGVIKDVGDDVAAILQLCHTGGFGHATVDGVDDNLATVTAA